MAEKILNTRLQLKYDSYESWYGSSIILKAGEVAIATVANNTTNANGTKFTNLPNVVIKVGDGTNLYKDLPFVSALAADVHEWAKAASAPTYHYSQITGLEDYVNSMSHGADTDTQYNLVAVDATNYKYELRSKGLADAGWTKVAYLDLSGLVNEIAALKDLVGTEKVSTQISNAIGAITVAATEVGQGEIISSVAQQGGSIVIAKRALAKEDIPVIEKTQVNGLDTALENAAKAGTDAADQALEDAKDYADQKIGAIGYVDPNYVEGQFVTKVIQQNGMIEVTRSDVKITDVTGLNTKLGEIDVALADLDDTKQDKLTFTNTPGSEEGKRVVTEEFVLNRLSELNGAMLFVGPLDQVPTGDGDGQYKAGNVILVGLDEYVFDGTEWLPLGNEGLYKLKSEANAEHDALQKAIDDGLAELDEAKQDNVNFKSAYSAENPVMTEDDVDDAIATAIANIDVAAVTVAKGEIIESVKQVDGAIEVTKRALKAEDIPMIQQSQVDGLADDLAAAAKAGTDAAAQALTDAKGYADDKITEALGAIDVADTAAQYEVVTKVDQVDGAIAVTHEALPKLAWTANVNDLVQTEGDVLVFYCGTATEVI